MKLKTKILKSTGIAFVFIMGIWAALFYLIIVEEISDEVDDSLEDYSEMIIIRALAGEELPHMDNGSNNKYYIRPISEQEALSRRKIVYLDEMYFDEEDDDYKSKDNLFFKDGEPARTLKTIFRDRDGQYNELIISTPTFERDDLLVTVLYSTIILFLLLLLTIILVNAIVFRKSLSPLYTLLNWLNSYKPGESTKFLDNDTNIEEFKTLNETVLNSINRQEELFEHQRQFIGNASHEIQTPLAICSNRLEMLTEDENLSEHSLEQIEKIQQSLDYIIKLNRSLLFLTKIENRQFTESSLIAVDNIVDNLVNDYSEIFEHRQIRVNLRFESKPEITANETLIKSLLGNLIRNAFIHNVDNGTIDITLSGHSVTVANTGGITSLDREKMYERFTNNNKKEGSTGLGLAIVKAVCDYYGYTIEYEYANGVHSFRIVFG